MFLQVPTYSNYFVNKMLQKHRATTIVECVIVPVPNYEPCKQSQHTNEIFFF